MSGYELSRDWFDFCFENPEKITPSHTAIFVFAIEHCNRLGWKQKFGFPTQMAMDALGIKKHQTYSRYFNDLCEWGFFVLVQKSANQYSANIISLSNGLLKNGKALGKAMVNHAAKHGRSTGQSKDSIDKPDNQITINKIIYAPLVSMFEYEYNKLVSEHGEEKTKWMINELDNYKGSSGKKYKDDYRAILVWVVDKASKNFKPSPKTQGVPIPKGFQNAQAYYMTCVEKKIKPVRWENGEAISDDEIETQFKIHKVGKYQYA